MPCRGRPASFATTAGGWPRGARPGCGSPTPRACATSPSWWRNPGVERHALDLVDRVEGRPADSGVDRRRLGDAGELIDSQARAAYRHRIEALRAEVDDALESGLDDRAEARQAELDQLVAQLAAAFGLGGRARRAASAAERARLNVTRALRAAIAKLAQALPEPGTALDRRLRTGLYCAYEPADDGVRWVVRSGVDRSGVAREGLVQSGVNEPRPD